MIDSDYYRRIFIFVVRANHVQRSFRLSSAENQDPWIWLVLRVLFDNFSIADSFIYVLIN